MVIFRNRFVIGKNPPAEIASVASLRENYAGSGDMTVFRLEFHLQMPIKVCSEYPQGCLLAIATFKIQLASYQPPKAY